MKKFLPIVFLFLMISEINIFANSKDLLPEISEYLGNIENEYRNINEARKKEMSDLIKTISTLDEENKEINLTFICTHNSRRSQMAQIWAQVAAKYYGFNTVKCYSGGTESTAFNPRAVKAMKNAGLKIDIAKNTDNPEYKVKYANNTDPLLTFSKKYSDDFNPQVNFIAVMVCSDADEACPFVIGADHRISLPYIDPKKHDNTDQEEKAYSDKCTEIAREMMFIFATAKEMHDLNK